MVSDIRLKKLLPQWFCIPQEKGWELKTFFAPWNMNNQPLKVAHNRPNHFFFQYCQSAWNQSKSHLLLHENVSLHNCNMILMTTLLKWPTSYHIWSMTPLCTLLGIPRHFAYCKKQFANCYAKEKGKISSHMHQQHCRQNK